MANDVHFRFRFWSTAVGTNLDEFVPRLQRALRAYDEQADVERDVFVEGSVIHAYADGAVNRGVPYQAMAAALHEFGGRVGALVIEHEIQNDYLGVSAWNPSVGLFMLLDIDDRAPVPRQQYRALLAARTPVIPTPVVNETLDYLEAVIYNGRPVTDLKTRADWATLFGVVSYGLRSLAKNVRSMVADQSADTLHLNAWGGMTETVGRFALGESYTPEHDRKAAWPFDLKRGYGSLIKWSPRARFFGDATLLAVAALLAYPVALAGFIIDVKRSEARIRKLMRETEEVF